MPKDSHQTTVYDVLSVTTRALSYLKEDSEEDDGNGGSDEELLAADVIRKSEDQGERNCASQAAVGQTKLIFHVEWDGAERVNDLCQHQDTWKGRVDKCHCALAEFKATFACSHEPTDDFSYMLWSMFQLSVFVL